MISVTPSLSTITPFKYKQSVPSSSFPSKAARKLEVTCPVPADIDIANSVEPLHISQIAEDLGLTSKHYDLYGKYKAKAITSVLEEVEGDENGYYVVVGGITPTPLGEGKSITTVGLCQALGAFLDKKHPAYCYRPPHAIFPFYTTVCGQPPKLAGLPRWLAAGHGGRYHKVGC